MRRIVHMSDLHFGRTRPELLAPLIETVNGAGADVVAISGDLTQRARNRQFRAARALMDRIEAPQVVVPGNHDVPLDNPVMRILRPYARYRRWIGPDLEPSHHDDQIAVLGVNTVNPFSWQRGRMRGRTLRRLRADLAAAPPGRINIIVAHHPFEQEPGTAKALMRGAAEALEVLAESGAHMVLTGHLHTWRAVPFLCRRHQRQVLQIHAGTGLSTRIRGEENDFARITFDRDEVEILRFVASEGSTAFAPAERRLFRRTPEGWRQAD